MEAVILAGGKGTRLRSVVSDVPKCMATVAGHPFLYYLLATLEKAGFAHVILSLGFKHEAVEAWLSTTSFGMKISYVVENQPLFTGGAVRLAFTQATETDVFVMNGDTFLGVDFVEMLKVHRQTGAKATLALKQMHNFDRYGVVDFGGAGCRILRFREKQQCDCGWINGGVYVIRKDELKCYPQKFSLETDYFEKIVSMEILSGYCTNAYFIDIGIPEDYRRAQTDFAHGRYNQL